MTRGLARAEAFAPNFGGAYFASRIRCPVRVLVGFEGDGCVPCAVFTTYNARTAPDRRIVCGAGMGHGGNTRPDLLRPLSERPREPWRGAAMWNLYGAGRGEECGEIGPVAIVVVEPSGDVVVEAVSTTVPSKEKPSFRTFQVPSWRKECTPC